MNPVTPLAPDVLVALVNDFGTRPLAAANRPVHARAPQVDDDGPVQIGGHQLTVKQAVDLADALWPVFSAHGAAREATLNALLVGARLTPQLDAHGQLVWTHGGAGSASDQVRAAAVATLVDLVPRRGWAALGVCGCHDCADVFLTLAGRPRRYCDATCLNRARVRNHRARAATG